MKLFNSIMFSFVVRGIHRASISDPLSESSATASSRDVTPSLIGIGEKTHSQTRSWRSAQI